MRERKIAPGEGSGALSCVVKADPRLPVGWHPAGVWTFPLLVEPVSAQNGPCGLAVVIGDADGGCQGFPRAGVHR